MATCKICKQEYWLDTNHESQHYGKKMTLEDHNKFHECPAEIAHAQNAVEAAQRNSNNSNGNGARNYYEEKEKKIEELALAKIAALNSIAEAIRELAKAVQESKK